MKYVHYPVTVIPEEWKKKAESAKNKAEEKHGEDYADYIASRSDVWASLKPVLEALSNGKCWYSEARDKVSYWQVDHFRPKSIYPWLAFDWQNYRLCGGIPNVAKLNNFPLSGTSVRATLQNKSINQEEPMLLDPTHWGDPDLLTFNGNGEPACARPNEQGVRKRVQETVRLFQLDSERLCSSRREKWRSCERKLKALRSIVEQHRHQANTDANGHLKEICLDLDELYSDEAEFTATAWACARQMNAEPIVLFARTVAQAA